MSLFVNKKRLVKIGAAVILLLTVQLFVFSPRNTEEQLSQTGEPGALSMVPIEATSDKSQSPIPEADSGDIVRTGGGFKFTQENNNSPVDSLFDLLVETKPKSPPLAKYIHGEKAQQKFSSDPDFHFSEKYLMGLLEIEETTLLDLETQHQHFVDKIRDLPMSIFGDPQKQISGDGIVMVGGGRFSWLALLNINQLRSAGCQLPVEVFIASEQEYERDFCDRLLPALNAKCVLGFEELPLQRYRKKLRIDGYQYKSLAIFASGFKRVLLLDADNVVIHNPDILFDWSVFEEYGLVLWPDCWSRTTHPYFYRIADIEVGDHPVRGQFMDRESPDEWNYHDLPGTLPNPASESGMLLVNKEKQVDTLFLSLYYNMFGPSHYYPLLTQGGAGQGDKDTFIAAAYALRKPVYQVKQNMKFLGYHDTYGFHAKALGQWDPTTVAEEKTPPYLSNFYDFQNENDSRLMFMHLSYPKLYPDKLRDEISWEQNGELRHRKLYPGRLPNSAYGFDLRMWELITQLICPQWTPNEAIDAASVEIQDKLTGLDLQYIKNSKGNAECESLFLPHLEYLRRHTSTEEEFYVYE
ncbi:hypothetical protein KL931_000357 [Ogataea haglerorum]|nr:hypothetical protein KL951_000357 [Ogataea haglerorum]KAG7751167.1 hypothetical protein KL912_000300 [Ogataea haglerorum]KAG7772017.1 hypothetical protein KL931_000357 [Ogataea haglerorum]KAG7791072.1 hypothetical protein KL945_000860 [Ogataea haglerorum]KAG7793661.1 hypothetical protein KL910_000356 [Ogataea haglerorum]